MTSLWLLYSLRLSAFERLGLQRVDGFQALGVLY